MKLSCPSCGAEMTLDVLLAHQAARDALLVALKLPPALAKPLLQYLSMFRTPRRQLSWDRFATLLTELQAPIAAAQVERRGRTWPAPIEYWVAALEQMVQLRDQGKLQLPLKSHGYLLEVIAGMTDKLEAEAEAKEEARRRGVSGSASPAHAPAPKVPQGERSAVPESVWDKLGGKGKRS